MLRIGIDCGQISQFQKDMSMKEKDIKLLWGRAGNRCAICRCELSQDGEAKGAAFTLGNQAHIVGESVNAARGTSPLTAEEREGYHNRILLCPTHHTEIDRNETAYPVEKLYYLKSVHELWVRETLGDSADTRLLAKQIAVTSIIDTTVEMCRLREWKSWTSLALAPDPRWDAEFCLVPFEFQQRVAAAIWPNEFEELKRATKTFAILLSRAVNEFMKHADYKHGQYVPNKFYKAIYPNPNYQRDLKHYEEWLNQCYGLIHEATCAANWFADVVRRDINPMFFAESGKFVVVDGPFSPKLTYRASIPEYSYEEKISLPSSLPAVG